MTTPVVYHEPGQTFTAAIGLALLIVVAFVLDIVITGQVHLVGFGLIFVIVVGIVLLATFAARSTRSITVTSDELRMGEHTVSRESIIGYERDVDADARILGRTVAEGLPRGTPGLALHMADGTSLVVPTRKPRELAAALELSLTLPEIRPADPAELEQLDDLEDSADTLFRVGGYGELPAARGHEKRDPLVVLVAGRPPVGFVRLDEVDGLAHIEQLSVVPGQQRQGLGTDLLDAVCAWAAAHGYPAVTLLTFAEVPWNAPFFARRGFSVMSELTPGLAEERDWERAIGLDAVGPRVAMRKEL